MCQKSLTEICTKSYLVKSSGHHPHILHLSKERCKMQEISSSVVNLSNEVSVSFCQWRHVYVLMSELSTICLKLLNCKSSCDVRLQVWFIFHSHWCLMSVSSQGYGSNTQLLPPNLTAYSQFLESTESMDIINVPVTF